MSTFRIIKPTQQLASYIRHYWILGYDSDAPIYERTLPVGCMQMVFHRGKQLLVNGIYLQPKSFISGQSFGFSDVATIGQLEMVVVVFQPYATNIFLRTPANKFYEQNIAIDDLEDSELSGLTKQIEVAPNIDLCISLIEKFLTRRLCAFSGYNIDRISTTLDEINIQPQVNISQLSNVACLSNKQFSRIFLEYVGATPKDFMRIIRMQRALHTLHQKSSISFVQLAYDCGFSDQSHMIKEFKRFSGYTPTEYISICSPYSDYFSDTK